MCSWSGKTIRVFARLKPGKIPPMGFMREAIEEAVELEPGDNPPQGFIDTLCFDRRKAT